MGEEPLATTSASQERLLRLCKLLYFLNGFSASSFGRFATIFYRTVAHLSAAQIGLVEAAQPIAGVVGNQLFGYVSDRLQRKKAVTLLARVVTTAVLLLLALPQVTHYMLYNLPIGILSVMATVAFFSVGDGVLDSYTLDLLGNERRGEYGRYRLWLAVSWGLGNVAMGLVAKVNFNVNFVAFGVLNAVNIILVAAALPARTRGEMELIAQRKKPPPAPELTQPLPPSSPSAQSPSREALSTRDQSTLWRALRRWRMVVFLLYVMALLGVGNTLVERFLFVYALDELGADSALCGYSVAMTVLFELPIFHFGELLIKRVGHDNMIMLATTSYVLRVLGYTRLTKQTVWYLLALEPFHGLTYGFFWTASVDKMKLEFPVEWQTTGQLLLKSMWSLGQIVGSLFGGFFYQHGSLLGLREGRALYAVTGLGFSALLAAHVLATLVLRTCGSRSLFTPPPQGLLAAATHTATRDSLPETIVEPLSSSQAEGVRPLNSEGLTCVRDTDRAA